MKVTPGIVVVGGVVAGIGAAAGVAALRRAATIPLTAVAHVDPQRYAGRWFEIARFPARFERKCEKNTTASYHLVGPRHLRIVNACTRSDGRLEVIEGTARVVAPSNAKLAVKFSPFMPAAPYWIIDLDEDYRYAVVGEPSRRYLWILARRTRLDAETLEGIYTRLRAKGYDPGALVSTPQD